MSGRPVVWIVWSVTDGYEGTCDLESIHATEAGAKKEAARLEGAMARANKRRTAWHDSDDENMEMPEWPKGVPDVDRIYVSGPAKVQG